MHCLQSFVFCSSAMEPPCTLSMRFSKAKADQLLIEALQGCSKHYKAVELAETMGRWPGYTMQNHEHFTNMTNTM